VNKGTGLRRIAGHMGLDPKEFAAIGDSNSDRFMFELAGYRASVANASPELKEISDYVAGAKYGKGFAEITDFMAGRMMF